jgi:hypothetical protein
MKTQEHMKTDKPERRSEVRKSFRQPIPFDHVTVQLKRVRNMRKNGAGFDISNNGAGMNVDFALKKGEIVKLFFSAKKVGVHVPVFAEVVCSVPTNDRFRIGLRFLQ